MRYPIMYANDTTVKALVDGIAAELDDGWAVERWEPREGGNHLYLLVKGDLRILVHHKTHGQCSNQRLTLTGLSPRAVLGEYDCDRGPGVEAKMTRSPRSVAKQLVRDLLPHYTAQTILTVQFDQRQAELASKAARLAEDFAGRLPCGKIRPPDLIRTHRTVEFGRPDGPRGWFTVYTSDDGSALGVEFGKSKASDPVFVEDLMALVNKHYA